MTRDKTKKRDVEIANGFTAGMTVGALAKDYKLAPSNVYRILKKERVYPRRASGKWPDSGTALAIEHEQHVKEHIAAMEQASITANEIQVGGDHYRTQPIQPWDYIAANHLNFFEGNIVKYVTRWRSKGGIDDLKKAMHYLAKLTEMAEKTA